eukprot:1180840-Prorocentrum_minimum.AAC.1
MESQPNKSNQHRTSRNIPFQNQSNGAVGFIFPSSQVCAVGVFEAAELTGAAALAGALSYVTTGAGTVAGASLAVAIGQWGSNRIALRAWPGLAPLASTPPGHLAGEASCQPRSLALLRAKPSDRGSDGDGAATWHLLVRVKSRPPWRRRGTLLVGYVDWLNDVTFCWSAISIG